MLPTGRRNYVNLFLVEKFAISYWEEEHKLYAAQTNC